MTFPEMRLAPITRPARLLAALLLAMLLASSSGGASPAIAQDASPSPESAAPSAPAPLPEGIDGRMAKRVAEIIDQVHPIRRLQPAEDVSYRVTDKEVFRAELEALFHEEYSDAYVAAEDDAFTRLGLLGPDDDLEELTLSLYESQVLAYYDPRTDTFSLVGPIDKIAILESMVIAHEYGHALQDAEWDLEGRRIKEFDRSDSILAQQALIEGDATHIMNDWVIRERALKKVIEVSHRAVSKDDEKMLRRLPPIIRRQLEFPYLEGYAFVNAIRGRGDWTAVNEVWDAQPVSTEQILHPELYPRELPVEIALPDVAGQLGPGWSTSYQQTLGEMQIGVWVADGRQGKPWFSGMVARLMQPDAAAGWGGDRLVSLDGPDGTWALVWQTDWDTDDDAKEFRKAARAVMKDLPGAHAATRADITGGLSSPVLVLVADGEGTLSAVNAALGLEP